MAQRNGTGMFPREVMNRFPLLPLEEEGRLNDLPLRENFIERVFAYYRWTQMLDKEPTPGGLVTFHTAHKLTCEICSVSRAMAHSPILTLGQATTPRWPGGTPGPPCRRCGQAGLGGIDSRVWVHAYGRSRCDGHPG
jgi:hypothetical protein